MSCLVKFGDMNAMSKMSVLPVLLSCAHPYSIKLNLDDFEYF